jgi:Phage integrase, N-terminal SAM-like domain
MYYAQNLSTICQHPVIKFDLFPMGGHPKKNLDQMRDAIRLKHYSCRTEKTYVDWVYRFILFHNKRHPKEMGVPEIEAFLTHLAVENEWQLPLKIKHSALYSSSLAMCFIKILEAKLMLFAQERHGMCPRY